MEGLKYHAPQIEIFYEECHSSGISKLQKNVNDFIGKSGKVSRLINVLQTLEAAYSYTGPFDEDGCRITGSGSTETWLIITVVYEPA